MNDAVIAQTIIDMATRRGTDKTVCPSEVARSMFGTGWRNEMEKVRLAAIALQQEGRIAILQKGQPVNVNEIKGPIRLKIL